MNDIFNESKTKLNLDHICVRQIPFTDAVIRALKSKSGEEKAKIEEELEVLVGKIKELPEIVKNYPKKNE